MTQLPSARIQELVRKHSRPRIEISLLTIAADWGLIAAACAFSRAFRGGWIISAVVIAGRMHALFVLMHDAAHFRLSSNRRVNDVVGDWLCGFPILMSLKAYRSNHFEHHAHTNTEKDPDWMRKLNKPAWNFPCTGWQFSSHLLRYVFGYGFLEMAFAIPILAGLSSKDRSIRHSAWLRLTAFTGLIVWIAMMGAGADFVRLWCVPYFVIFPIYNRVRSIAEHFGLNRKSPFESSRNVTNPSWLERLTIAPHQVNLHLTHHLYPSVCFHQLKQFDGELERLDSTYRNSRHLTESYVSLKRGSVVREIISEKQGIAGHFAIGDQL